MMYSIVHLTPDNNVQIAKEVTAKHAASFSGGVPSAFMVEEIIKRYGRENTVIWFADVKQEDPDLYRFVGDCIQRWGGRLYWYTDGRRPLDVAEQKQLIPCDLHCPCSYELKIKPFRQFIKAMPDLPIVYIGLERHETKRLAKTTKSYAQAIPLATVEYPLLWHSWSHRQLFETVASWGIEIPRMYKQGYKHNNCGGRCVRQGIKEWVRTGYYYPERYAEMEEWEQTQRSQGGARANRSYCSVQRNHVTVPMPLTQLREEYFSSAHHLLKITGDNELF